MGSQAMDSTSSTRMAKSIRTAQGRVSSELETIPGPSAVLGTGFVITTQETRTVASSESSWEAHSFGDVILAIPVSYPDLAEATGSDKTRELVVDVSR